MNIAFLIDILPKSGGANSALAAECNVIKKLYITNINIKLITTSKITKIFLEKEFKTNIIFYKKSSILNQIYLFFYKSNFIKFLLKRLKIRSNFENLLDKNQIDLVIFVAPSDLVLQLNKINFVYTIWEFQHKNYPFFPEYKNVFFDIDTREEILNFVSNKAFRVFVGTDKSREDFSKLYLCDINKILIRPITSSITSINSSVEIQSEFITDFKKKKIKNYLFYPAQYWPHKNHKFIIDSLDYIKKNQKISYQCIFTGSDKGNLNYIKKLINDRGLSELIFTYEFLSDEEIAFLYKNCFAVIVPTFVGTVSFPIIEGFFFKKPVIANIAVLDEVYKDKLFNLNLNDYKCLEEILIYMKSNPKKVDFVIEDSYRFFKKTYEYQDSLNQLKNLINEYNFYQQTWKN